MVSVNSFVKMVPAQYYNSLAAISILILNEVKVNGVFHNNATYICCDLGEDGKLKAIFCFLPASCFPWVVNSLDHCFRAGPGML